MGMMGGMMGNMGQPTQQGGATVQCGCGASMNANAKFCPECGKPNSTGTVACIGCGAQIKQGAKFCPECGKPQSATCGKCNASVPGGVKFCPECGEKIQ